MATNEELSKILKGEISEEELRKSFEEAGLDYDKSVKETRKIGARDKAMGINKENEPLPESYKYPDMPRR